MSQVGVEFIPLTPKIEGIHDSDISNLELLFPIIMITRMTMLSIIISYISIYL